MKLRRPRAEATPPTVYVGDHIDRLSRVTAIAHDEDETQSREDKLYGEPLLERVLVLPPKLFRRRKPRH
jgi:hypothetical protein